MVENPQYAELYRAAGFRRKDENILSSEKRIILTAHRNMKILNRQRKEAEIAGIHQGDSMKILGRGDGNHDANRRISAASIYGNTVARENGFPSESF